MPNRPFQVCIYPFRRQPQIGVEYALFKNREDLSWTGIMGLCQLNVLPLKVAKKDAYKIAAIPIFSDYYLLKAVAALPVAHFNELQDLDEEDIFIIPGYYFGVDCSDIELAILSKILQHQWVPYAQAYELLRRDTDKTALWELNERIQTNNLPRSL